MSIDGTGFGLTDDDGRTSAHNKDRGKQVDSHMATILTNMPDDEYAALISAVEAERGPKRPAGVREAAEAYRTQGDGMKIPGGSLTPRMRRMLADANGDTFTVQDGRAGREIDLG